MSCASKQPTLLSWVDLFDTGQQNDIIKWGISAITKSNLPRSFLE